MHPHPLDLTSLIWGIILASITSLLAVLVWTDAQLDLGLAVPGGLICAGALALVVGLLRRPRGNADH